MYDLKGHGDLCGRFDLVYDRKSSRSHKRLQLPTLWPRGLRDLCSQFDLVYDPKGQEVVRGRRDLLSDPSHDDLYDWFDLVYDPKRSPGHYRSRWPTLLLQRSNWHLIFDLDLKVKHLVWQDWWPQATL